jgi:hypothetical protein
VTTRARGTARLVAAATAAVLAVTITACGGPGRSPETAGSQLGRTDEVDPADPVRLAGFVRLSSDTPAIGERVEVTDAAALDRHLSALPQAAARDLRAQLSARVPVSSGARLFAFLLTGCAETGARLTIGTAGAGAERLTARLTGGADTNCYVPNYFVVIFAVPERRLR